MKKLCRGNLYRWFRRKHTAALGVLQQDDIIYMVYMEKDEARQPILIWQDKLVRQAQQTEAEFIETACMRGQQNAAPETVCYIVLEGQDVFYYEKDFSHLTDKELRRAAELDFAAASPWQKDYVWGFEVLPGGSIRLGGIIKDNLQQKLQPWQKFFACTAGILYCQEDAAATSFMSGIGQEAANGNGCGAIFGAWAGMQERGIILHLDKPYLHKWNWLHLAACCGAVSALAIWGIGALWYFSTAAIDTEINQQQGKLTLLRDVAERKAAIAEANNVAERKNRKMESLHEKNLSGQALLINIGRAMHNGIWLTGLSARSGEELVLQGKAAGYSQVSGLMNDLQQEKSAFQDRFTLASTEMGKDGLISFQMKGKL